MTHQHHQPVLSLSADLSDTTWIGCRVGLLLQVAAYHQRAETVPGACSIQQLGDNY